MPEGHNILSGHSGSCTLAYVRGRPLPLASTCSLTKHGISQSKLLHYVPTNYGSFQKKSKLLPETEFSTTGNMQRLSKWKLGQ